MSNRFSRIPTLLAACILCSGGLAAASGPVLGWLSVAREQKQLEDIDAELAGLANFSLNSGVGPIGFRSRDHADANHREWVRVNLGEEAEIDEVILVPVLWRDLRAGFVADAFPASLKIIAGKAGDEVGTVVADFPDTASLLPRIAPLVVPAGGVRASWIRIESDKLSKRAFDGRNIFQLAEVLVFSGERNLALRRDVTVPTDTVELAAWNRASLVDGILPYVMNSGRGNPSVAFLSAIGIGDQPTIQIDLQKNQAITGIRLHSVEQSDTVPQAFAGDYGLPRKFRIDAANEADFSDARQLLEIVTESIYEVGPLMEWGFPETLCRHIRLVALNPYISQEAVRQGSRIGYAEIEILTEGRNVAVGCPVRTDFSASGPDRHVEALTDAHNLFGRILPLRQWLGELARRHDLEAARPHVVAALSKQYTQQRTILNWALRLALGLVIVIALIIIYHRIRSRSQEMRIRERIAANLHDELGANLHAIGLLGDLAKEAVDSREDLVDTLDEIRSLTVRTGSAARNCAHMIAAKGLCEDLTEEMRRDSRRLLADLKHSITFSGEELLPRLSRRKRMDLYLFHKEALVNVLRHSGATEASTRFQASHSEVLLTITDNGCGLANGVPASLARRARLLGAEIRTEQPEGGGTRISLKLRIRRFGILR
jgi:signal transduction histidine kinase